MRRLKSDASHRMRPRAPSIFSAGWFRLLLGSGIAVILGLLIGPSVAAWLGADLPSGVRLLTPWSRSESPIVPEPVLEQAEGPATLTGQAAVPGPASTGPPRVALTTPPSPPLVIPPGPPGATARPATPDLTAPPPVFRIQVGAFLEHANADRLVERLRSEGLGAATSVFEQSRVLYRVLVVPPEGDPLGGGVSGSSRLVDQLRDLGLAPETTAEGIAATGSVSLGAAVEASHRLREQGIRVRLKQEVGSATYRVVRVGAYETTEEAERALATLAARGFEGFVVRER